jgi:hypothetical protein
MATATGRIIQEAVNLVTNSPDGMRYSELHRRIAALMPEIPPNTITGALHKFRTELPQSLYLPTRGLYRHVRFREVEPQVDAAVKAEKEVREESFYSPFADWLIKKSRSARRPFR